MREMLTMQEAPDLGIPEVKPAIESMRGRWVQKMSPRRRHGILQARLCGVLTEWAGERGEVASEWRFYLLPKDERPSSLVPDVAYVSFERMPIGLGEWREEPTIAPDIAVEIVSPDDRRRWLDEKITFYLAYGTLLVIVVDPQTRSIEMHEPDGTQIFREPAIAACNTYGDLQLETSGLFDRL